jgi:hypothetical protein
MEVFPSSSSKLGLGLLPPPSNTAASSQSLAFHTTQSFSPKFGLLPLPSNFPSSCTTVSESFSPKLGLLPPSSNAASSSHSSRTTCLSPGCLMTRIHPECTGFMCRRHCLEAGGCLVKSHSKDDQFLATQASQLTSTILQAPSTRTTMETLSSPPLTTSKLRQQGQDLHANLRYSSQMPAVFTEQSAREQQLQESRRAAEAEHLRNVRKVNGCVTCYGWPSVC